MDKFDFMRILEKQLGSMGFETRKEIMDEYDRHIEEALEEGHDEHEIIARLGDPKEIGREIIEMETEESSPPGRSLTDSKQFSEIRPEEINSFDIKGNDLNIYIEKGNHFDMNYHGQDKQGDFDFYQQGNTFVIKHSRSQRRTFKSFIINRKVTSDSVHIIWPYSIETLHIDTDQGKLSVSGMDIEHLKLESDMGRISGKHLNCRQADFKSQMGSIQIEDSAMSRISANTQMGAITLKRCMADEYVLDTQMGRISVVDMNPESDVNASSQMGAVKVQYKAHPVETLVLAKANFGTVVNAFEENRVMSVKHTAKFSSEMGSVKVT
ncbi:DUF4097 family beta strand repeat-containing protein [Salinicoccus sesuvii]|uniref:DUF4097 family beta strand repeat-containing protein n=1 Tax=Salinicoccus sesuvii TaxID=868281 RepID=A0ABV7N586_9STAP